MDIVVVNDITATFLLYRDKTGYVIIFDGNVPLKTFGRFEGIIVISLRTLGFIANGPIKLNN